MPGPSDACESASVCLGAGPHDFASLGAGVLIVSGVSRCQATMAGRSTGSFNKQTALAEDLRCSAAIAATTPTGCCSWWTSCA
mmetsp:Transcript_29390/g.68310  ORF Transcript_29390/g.68310 Transcript_29390/m.68310 type:complete len:83 (+) Transcript_29390:653-901(+)